MCWILISSIPQVILGWYLPQRTHSQLCKQTIQGTHKSSLPCHIILPLSASLKLIQFLYTVMEQFANCMHSSLPMHQLQYFDLPLQHFTITWHSSTGSYHCSLTSTQSINCFSHKQSTLYYCRKKQITLKCNWSRQYGSSIFQWYFTPFFRQCSLTPCVLEILLTKPYKKNLQQINRPTKHCLLQNVLN